MSGMGDHSQHEAAGAPLRRAHRAAWFTFTFMAATTMTFQTYHSVKSGQMPGPLAVLFGIAAFTLAITVLEFARHSPSRWVRGGAYMLTAGAMYMSASATGDVVLHAAPPHASLLFGLLMDGAAILAIHFILNGPTAAQAVAKAGRREAELTASVTAAREALGQAVAGHREALAEAEARHRSTVARIGEANAAEVNRLAANMESLHADLGAARRDTEALAAKNEALTRKLGRATGPGKGGAGTRKQAGTTAKAHAPAKAEVSALGPDDLPGNWSELDTEARVLFLVNEKGYSASKAGIAADVTDARGRQIVRMARGLSATAPQDVVGGTSAAD